MKMTPLFAMRKAVTCALFCAVATQADAMIAGVVNSQVDTATATQGAMGLSAPCSPPSRGLGLRLEAYKPYRRASEVTLHYAAATERNIREQAHECPQRHWTIPAGDLTVMRRW
jgi:hypothetical protein